MDKGMDRNCAAEARPSEVHRSGAITRAVDRGLHHQMRGYRPVSRRTELLLEQLELRRQTKLVLEQLKEGSSGSAHTGTAEIDRDE
jgi:hypothetical protein